jgi:hypothetical protein
VRIEHNLPMINLAEPLANYVKSLSTADADLPVKCERKLEINYYYYSFLKQMKILVLFQKFDLFFFKVNNSNSILDRLEYFRHMRLFKYWHIGSGNYFYL